ncbi:MAG: WD40-repeat-containing domain protein [Monoraphidium minutum]|nr:MAG: WD40-repeat-containing domain protein [Monoraphidium minutum]
MLRSLLDREMGAGGSLGGGRPAGARGALQLYQGLSTSGSGAGVIAVDPAGQPAPPFALAYSRVLHGSRLLAVADEEGWVCVVDTGAERLPSSLHMDAACAPKAQWLAHQNTIYDVAWAKNDSLLYTASGDHYVGVWDTHTAALRCYCKGHAGSVKAVSAHGSQTDVLASGARDGAVLIWDLRAPARWSARRQRNTLDPVARIDAAGGAKGGGAAARSQPRRSVTALAWLPGGRALAAAGDMDGVVRVWDVRMTARGPARLLQLPAAGLGAAAAGSPAGTPAPRGGGAGQRAGTPGSAGKGSAGKARGGGGGGAAQPWIYVTCPQRGARPHGVTSLAVSPSGDTLLVSCSDGAHHLYPTASLDRAGPWASLAGHRATSFCVKAAFSPDGAAIASGSSDGAVHVWSASDPSAPPVRLYGHNGEVTSVAWCPSDPCQLATASDDATVRVWTLGAGRHEAAAAHAAAAGAAEREERRAAERATAAAAAAAVGPRRAGGAGARGGQASARDRRAAVRDYARAPGRRSGGLMAAAASPAAAGAAAAAAPPPATPGSGPSSARPLRQALITERLQHAQPPAPSSAPPAGAAGALNGARTGAGGAEAAAPARGAASTPPAPRGRPSRPGALTPLAWAWSGQHPEAHPPLAAGASSSGGGPFPGLGGPPLCPRHPFGCRCHSGGDEFSVFEDPSCQGGAAGTSVGGPAGGAGARRTGDGGGSGAPAPALQRALSFDTSIIEASAPQQEDAAPGRREPGGSHATEQQPSLERREQRPEREQQQQQDSGSHQNDGGSSHHARPQQEEQGPAQRRRGPDAGAAQRHMGPPPPAHAGSRLGRSCLGRAAGFGFPEVERSGSPSRDSWPAVQGSGSLERLGSVHMSVPASGRLAPQQQQQQQALPAHHQQQEEGGRQPQPGGGPLLELSAAAASGAGPSGDENALLPAAPLLPPRSPAAGQRQAEQQAWQRQQGGGGGGGDQQGRGALASLPMPLFSQGGSATLSGSKRQASSGAEHQWRPDGRQQQDQGGPSGSVGGGGAEQAAAWQQQGAAAGGEQGEPGAPAAGTAQAPKRQRRLMDLAGWAPIEDESSRFEPF